MYVFSSITTTMGPTLQTPALFLCRLLLFLQLTILVLQPQKLWHNILYRGEVQLYILHHEMNGTNFSSVVASDEEL